MSVHFLNTHDIHAGSQMISSLVEEVWRQNVHGLVVTAAVVT